MNEDKKPLILISLIESGMGHIVAAQAINDALKDGYGDAFDIKCCYLLRDSGNDALIKHEKYLVKNVRRYGAWRGFGHFQIPFMYLFGPQNTLELVYKTAFRKAAKALIAEYAEQKPDVIVSTHFFTHYCAVKYKQRYAPNVKVVSYCPDNNIHGWWHVKADVIYTNNPFATAQAYKLGFKSGSVKEAFYPTRSQVLQTNESKQYYREKLGIPQDKPAVAISDGFYSQSRAAKICRQLLKTDLPITICLLTGKDGTVKAEFDKVKDKTKPNVTLLTYGFIDNVPELYAACDLFITKAGPNAILDSVMMQTPIIVDYCATPIESKTRDLFINKRHCGYFITSPTKIKRKVEELFGNPELLRQFDKALRFFDKNINGARLIADDIASLILNQSQHRESLIAQEDEIIDKYYAHRKNGDKRKKLFKTKFHNGKNNKKFAKILNKTTREDY